MPTHGEGYKGRGSGTAVGWATKVRTDTGGKAEETILADPSGKVGTSGVVGTIGMVNPAGRWTPAEW